MKGLWILVGSRVGGSKNRRKENVVKRTMRYRFEKDFWQNQGMINNEEVKSKNVESAPECGIRSAECGISGKARGDSILGGLAAEQQAKVKQWLFEDNLAFAAVAERCRSELGVEVSKTSVIRYYRREASVRRLEAGWHRRERSPDAAGNANEYYAELMAMAGEMALDSARGELDEEKRRAFVECTKLLISARREGNYARRVDLARERFEFDAATACIVRQLEIQAIVEDDTLTDEERVRSVREELFGPNLPE
jgi:hypothetical protein